MIDDKFMRPWFIIIELNAHHIPGKSSMRIDESIWNIELAVTAQLGEINESS